ncbi:hypothetical protein M378DRAFT_14649 [Amanita muscaria Koide BX008]|uniref:DUF6699 domain-containing protein n=1 Tax=Amanita muscaria (strain Koide BX008) TaxID=946122 RepID=A0A0C2WSI3_AMAMK|nr:hypothetical protein M378DRAFT_14649 [Amanita muscaria Koide BX008]
MTKFGNKVHSHSQGQAFNGLLLDSTTGPEDDDHSSIQSSQNQTSNNPRSYPSYHPHFIHPPLLTKPLSTTSPHLHALPKPNAMRKSHHPKRVHFSENCLTFAPITTIHVRTPSPTDDSDHSASSSSSSPDPPTPPPMQYVPSPYPFAQAALISTPGVVSPSQFPTPMPGMMSLLVPTPTPSPPHSLPPQKSESQMMLAQQMNVHHLLAFSPSSVSILLYNVLNPPNIQNLAKNCQRPIYELEELATNPPLPQMTITSSLLPDQWHIKVTPSRHRTELAGMFSPSSTIFSPMLGMMSPDAFGSPTGGAGTGYITVLDVLLALYTSLRMIVHPSEYKTLTRSPVSPTHTEESVTSAFWARIASVQDPKKREEQRRKGVRRIDFLGSDTKFLGLTGTLKNDEWELELGDWKPLPMVPSSQGDQQ